MENKGSNNNLLVPKWKNRTHDTHIKHLNEYQGGKYPIVFLGDSMMERWLTTGKSHWKNTFSKCANLGVGGDGVEHLLYRLTTGSDTVRTDEFKGILDVITTDLILLMIGTNNLEKNSPDEILEGIINIIRIILEKTSSGSFISSKLIVFGLPDRTDRPKETISELNLKLKGYINDMNNPRVSYSFFGDYVNYDDKFFDDSVHLSYLGYDVWYDHLKELLKL